MANLSADWDSATPVDLTDEWEKAAPVETTVPKATGLERGRAGLSGVNTGIARLLGLPVDTAENIANLGLAGFGTAATALGKPQWAPDLFRGTPGGSESLLGLMRGGGIETTNPRPDDPASRMLHTGGMIAGGSLIPGATVPGTLAASAGGALAGEVLGPEWVGVGALAPAAASQAASGVKNAIASRTAPTLETFKQAGAQPSVGQVTDNTFLHGLENLATKFPGGAGVMEKFITAQQTAMGKQARTGVPAEAAGRAIEKGITGEAGFIARTKATWSYLDDAVAAKIPKSAEIAPVNTLRTLDELTAAPKGAEAVSKVVTNPKLQQMYEGFRKDMAAPFVPKPGTEVPSIYKTIDRNVIEQPQSPIQKTIETAATELHPHGYGQPSPPVSFPQTDVRPKTTVPYQTLRALRSKVGSMLDDTLVSGIPGGELKKLYGALSRDMEFAATQSGASREFARQNNYYHGRMMRIETVLDRVIGKSKQPEDIFKSVMPTDPDQANKLRATLRSLSTEERQVVSEAVANRLGRAKPGAQDVEGTVFSSETFLSNWNRLSPGAKAQLFPDPPLRENMDKIARASGTIREGKGIYANPSGTAGSFAAYSVYLSPLASIASGSLAPVVAAGTAAASAFIGAKMLTSPKVVEWLATPVNPKTPQAAAHLARLGVIYNNTKDEKLKEELANFVQSVPK